MALIVETGTGATNSESYASVADADLYFSNRAVTVWATLATNIKEASLRKATDYLTQKYRGRWKGARTTLLQALDYPRAYVTLDDLMPRDLANFDFIAGVYLLPNNVVPVEVRNACVELALKAVTSDLNPDLTQGVIREKVDVLEVEYDKYSSQSPRYKAIDNMLSPYLTGSANSHRVVRT